jgi:hypothetical protein
MESLTTYVEEDTADLIRDIANHHDIPQSTALRLVIREGISQRSRRYQNELIDAKLNHLLSELGIDNIDAEVAQKRREFVLENEAPDATIDEELADTPHDIFDIGEETHTGGPETDQAKQAQTE